MCGNESNIRPADIFMKSCVNVLTYLIASRLLERIWLVLFMIYVGIPLIRGLLDSNFLFYVVPVYRPYATVIFVGFIGLAVLRRFRSKPSGR